jgi:hypothetical protein
MHEITPRIKMIVAHTWVSIVHEVVGLLPHAQLGLTLNIIPMTHDARHSMHDKMHRTFAICYTICI